MPSAAQDHVDSYYAASSRDMQVRHPELADDLDVDVVVLGAGYTGLYTALNLAEAGHRVAVLEARRVGCIRAQRGAGHSGFLM